MAIRKMKTFRRKVAKGKGKRYGKRKYTTKLVNTALQPIPQRYITKMKYCETYTPINSTGQTIWRVNLNSIFDPNRTGIGHQPYGHDTFATLYNRYRVIACNFVISAFSGNGSTIQLAAIPANEEFIAASISEYRENPRCRFMVQTPGSVMRVMKGKVNLPSLTGRTVQQYMADDRYQAQFGASPSELMVLNINSQQFDESLLTATAVTYQLTLEYVVELFDPKNLGQS